MLSFVYLLKIDVLNMDVLNVILMHLNTKEFPAMNYSKATTEVAVYCLSMVIAND